MVTGEGIARKVTSYKSCDHSCLYISVDCYVLFVSDPPLEEDDIPDGEWLCNECKAMPKEVHVLN